MKTWQSPASKYMSRVKDDSWAPKTSAQDMTIQGTNAFESSSNMLKTGKKTKIRLIFTMR